MGWRSGSRGMPMGPTLLGCLATAPAPSWELHTCIPHITLTWGMVPLKITAYFRKPLATGPADKLVYPGTSGWVPTAWTPWDVFHGKHAI